MALALAVTVIGLKIVGLILIVAMLIIPPVTARFWTERTDHMVLISGLCGGLAAWIGAALSAVAPAMPTGPIIVLVSFGLFVASLLLAPSRGVLAVYLHHVRFQRRVHLRQGLLALAQGQPIYEAYTVRLLKRAGLALADGVPTEVWASTCCEGVYGTKNAGSWCARIRRLRARRRFMTGCVTSRPC